MADLPAYQTNYNTELIPAVDQKWLQARVQEKKSLKRAKELQVEALKQKVEDIQKGEIPNIEGHIIMLEREINYLESQRV